jgi:hypothetical protein
MPAAIYGLTVKHGYRTSTSTPGSATRIRHDTIQLAPVIWFHALILPSGDRTLVTAFGRIGQVATTTGSGRLAAAEDEHKGIELLQEQLGDNRSQPLVRRIMVIALVPMLFDRESRQVECR